LHLVPLYSVPQPKIVRKALKKYKELIKIGTCRRVPFSPRGLLQ
jgi:hypothetical protein